MFSGLNSETISEKHSKVTAYSKKSINYHFLNKLFFQTANFIKMQTVNRTSYFYNLCKKGKQFIFKA